MSNYRVGTMALIETGGRTFGAYLTSSGVWLSDDPGAETVSLQDGRVIQVFHEPGPNLAHEDVVAASETMRRHAYRVSEGEVPVMDWYGMAYAALAAVQ